MGTAEALQPRCAARKPQKGTVTPSARLCLAQPLRSQRAREETMQSVGCRGVNAGAELVEHAKVNRTGTSREVLQLN